MFVSPTNIVGQATAPRLAARSEPVYLIVRSDAGGMSHRVNMTLEPLIKTDMPVSLSVVFATPWAVPTLVDADDSWIVGSPT